MAKVQYSLALLAKGTNSKKTSLKVGEVADLAVFVRDLRPNGTWTNAKGQQVPLVRGVFAAYLNLSFNYNNAQVVADSFRFGPAYPNGLENHAAKGSYTDTGAFASSFTGLGTTPYELFRMSVKGVRIGTTTFTPSFNVTRPKCDTLVYGNIAANPPEDSHVEVSDIVSAPLSFSVVSSLR